MLIFEPADCLYWTRYNYPNINVFELDNNSNIVGMITPLGITSNKLNIDIPDEIVRLEYSHQEKAFEDYIIYNDGLFLTIMQIITLLYNGEDVVILTKPDSLIFDLLSNLIYNRYGYNCIIINEPEDIMPLSSLSENEKGSFSIQGLSFLDSDNARYAYLVTKMQIG